MFIIQILYIFYLAFCQENENENQYLSLGISVQGFVSPKTQTHHVYKFIVPEIKNGTDLIVYLKTLNPNSDPNLYISKTVEEPLKAQDADIKACEANGMDICVINSQLIKEEDLLYISVVSRSPSRYSLRIELDQEQTLFIDSFLTFKMNNEKQIQIIDFVIQELVKEQTEIELSVQVQNQELLEEPFQVFMNKYENGPPSNNEYDYKAIDTWEDQKVIEFNQTKPFEKYKILIQGEQGALFRVIATRSQALKTLNYYENIIQVVDKGEFDYYFMDNSNIQYECDIGIRLTPFKGYAKLFVNYNTQPPLLESYEWQDDKQDREFIYISQQELKNRNITLNSLYITVIGQDLCTYLLSVTCESEMYIQSGVTYQKDLQKSDNLKFWILDNQYNSLQIQLNLYTLQGIINFLITNCNDESLCPFSQELFTEQQKYEQIKDYIMIYSNSKQQAQFFLDCQGWCTFYLLAYIDPNSKQNGRFSVSYKNNEKTINLKQNTPHKSTINKDSYQYYKYFVSDQDQLQRLHFFVTSIQGDVSMYLSNKYQQPNKENHEFNSQNNSINFGGRYNSNQPQSGTYYLAIYGESYSKYMITVWTIQNFDDFNQLGRYPWHYIQLYQGDPQEHHLENDEFVLYKIDLKGYDQTQKDSINIILQKAYGQLQMFGFDHPETDESKAKWQSGQIISILINDINYPEILYLKIRLISSESNYASFRIAFYSFNEIIDIRLDEPFFSFLPANYNQNFRYEYGKNEKFVISKKPFEFDQTSLPLDFQITYDLNVRFSKNNNSIIIEQNQDLYCSEQEKICSQFFYFYIGSKFDQFYSILISRIDQSQIQLKEDQPISKVLPISIGEDYFYLYCYGQEVNVLAYSYFGKLRIYASIVQSLDSPEPNEKSADKISKNQKVRSQATINFSQMELQKKNCINKCIIKLTVSVAEIFMDDMNANAYDYTIQFNSKLILLREAEIQEGFITKDEFKYYKIHISNKNDSNLMIMLKPDSNCEADLLVSKTQYPNLVEYDWGSFNFQSDAFIIEPGNYIHPNLTGDYYVGVHGYQECQFVIQYNLGQFESYDIFLNQPFKFYVRKDYTIYLILNSYQDTSAFMIFVQSLSETTYFYVDQIDFGSAKFNAFQKKVSEFKYNNYQQGYQKCLKTDPINQDQVLVIALKTYVSEIVTIQVSSNVSEIYLESKTLFQYFLEQNQNVKFIINPNFESQVTQLQIHLYSGSVSCDYSYEDYSENQDYITLHLLDIHQDNHKNVYNISNKQNQYLKIHFEAIYSSHFSIQYFNEKEENNYIQSIYPQHVLLQSQSEKQLWFVFDEFSQVQSNLKTFSISVQISEYWNPIISILKKQTLPILTVYSNTSQLQIYPIQQTILSNLIYNEYIQTDTSYKIVLQNQQQFEQYYQIWVGTSDLRLLIPKIKQLGINKFSQSTYWALQPTNGYIFYEMQFCNGIFSVYTGSQYESLKNGQYDQKIDIKQKQVFGFLEKKVYLDMIFLKFNFIKQINSKLPFAQYTIRVYQVEDKNDIPYNIFFPGSQGYLTSNIIDDNDENLNLIIEFSPLEISKADEQETFEVKQFEYFVILQEGNENEDAEINYCSEPFDQHRIVRNFNETDISLIFNLTFPKFKQQNQRNFVFTILATVDVKLFRDDQRIQLDYYYEPQHIRWNSKQKLLQEQKPLNYQLIGVCIAIILLVFIVVAFLRMKKRQIISKYENTEVRVQQTEGIEMHYRNFNE